MLVTQPLPVATSGQSALTATSIEDHGVIWNFSSPCQVGQFVAGGWWVKGPVTISSVTPAWDGTRHGSVLDMGSGPNQGLYNGCIFGFDNSLRATFPLTVNDGQVHSLISTIGRSAPASGGAQEALLNASILTVVPRVPSPSLFRPPYMGPKNFYNWSSGVLKSLPNLALPGGAVLPTPNQMTRPWPTNFPSTGLDVGGIGAALHPDYNMPPYPRDSALVVSQYACALCVNSPDLHKYVLQMTQLGIDLYGVHTTARSDGFMALGGYGNGWKFPILFAGRMLGNTAMQNPGLYTTLGGPIFAFGEDGHTYYGAGGRAMWGADLANLGYTLDPVTHQYYNNNDGRDPNGVAEAEAPPGHVTTTGTIDLSNAAYRVCCTSFTWVGQCLAARLLGMKTLWGHDAWFDYVDRWIADNYNPGGTLGNIYGTSFIQSMWGAYR